MHVGTCATGSQTPPSPDHTNAPLTVTPHHPPLLSPCTFPCYRHPTPSPLTVTPHPPISPSPHTFPCYRHPTPSPLTVIPHLPLSPSLHTFSSLRHSTPSPLCVTPPLLNSTSPSRGYFHSMRRCHAWARHTNARHACMSSPWTDNLLISKFACILEAINSSSYMDYDLTPLIMDDRIFSFMFWHAIG